MQALAVFLLMLILPNGKGEPLPIRGPADYAFRWELATRIVEATDDAREREVLVRTALLESGFRRNVARCEKKGDRGRSHGTFQIQPQSPREAKVACSVDRYGVATREQVDLALRYVRRSAEACPANVGPDRLAMYVSGTCARGIPEARARWGEEVPLLASEPAGPAEE